jgi:hypothetical protein
VLQARASGPILQRVDRVVTSSKWRRNTDKGEGGVRWATGPRHSSRAGPVAGRPHKALGRVCFACGLWRVEVLRFSRSNAGPSIRHWALHCLISIFSCGWRHGLRKA